MKANKKQKPGPGVTVGWYSCGGALLAFGTQLASNCALTTSTLVFFKIHRWRAALRLAKWKDADEALASAQI